MKLRDLGMKTHKKTRIILIIIAALVAIFSSIAIITTTANNNNANAEMNDPSTGIATVGAGGNSGGSGDDPKAADVWWYGDKVANLDSIESAMHTRYPYRYNFINASGLFKYNSKTIKNKIRVNNKEDSWWGIALNNAIDICKGRHKNNSCDDPHIVALGWPQYVDNSNPWCGSTVCPDGDAVGTISRVGQKWCTNQITVEGNTFNLNTKIGDRQQSICDSIYSSITENAKVSVTVLSKDEYQQSGWLPTFGTVDFDAYTSRVRVNSHKLEPCPYEYTMQAKGIDGYVKGYDTKQERYKTSYGRLWDSIATSQHKGNAIKSGAYSGAYLDGSQNEKNEELIAEHDRTCAESKEPVDKDNFNIESETATNQSGNSISGKEFIDKYAKGGIYKVIRGKHDAIINYKTTDIEYYKAFGSYDVPTGWEPCTYKNQSTRTPNGKTVYCSDHWNKPKPKTGSEYPAMMNIRLTSGWNRLVLGDYDKKIFFDNDGNITTDNTKAANYTKDQAEDIVKAAEGKCDNILYSGSKDITGEDIKDACNAKKQMFLYNSGYRDMNGNWIQKNELVAKDAGGWNANWNSFINDGFPGPYINNQIHPVRQEFQSWKHVWHQDFMNILCDKNDFDNYKTALDVTSNSLPGFTGHIYTDISKVSDGSKYQGQLKSPVIDSEFISKYNVSDTWEPFDRVLYTVSTLTADKKNFDIYNPFANISSVIGKTSADDLLTKAKSVNSAYNTDNFINWYNSAAYDASLDPVYTKECPYDCTDDAGGTASSSNDNVVNGKTEDGASPSASGLKKKTDERATGDPRETGAENDYGVRVRTTDSKGNLKDSSEDVNTANMTFFRNNTWNRFRVDIWYPIFKDGLTAASASDSIRGISETKGSQTAKSTTIIRNGGTPWYVKGNDSTSGFATEMKVIKSLDNGDSIDGSNARLFNPEIDKITPGNQISLGSVTARGANVVELPYEATAFAIRSMWATDPNIGKLEFNIKWEFDSKNNLDVPTKFTVGNTADSVSSTSTPQYAISDGKCYGNQNKGQSYDYDLINLFHDNTGAGTIDNLDKEFNDNFGKFTIQFVRSTAE